MHPFLFHIGTFAVPTYGLFAVAALLAAVWIVRRYARIEGLDPTKTSDAIVLTVAVGFVGARVLELLINWERYVGTPGGWKALSLSAGVYYGGLLTAIPFGIFWFRKAGIPMLVGLDILALVAAVAMGVGRWGCFFSGCCWGTPTDLPWAVTFPAIAQRLHKGLPGVPLHPTQIYISLYSFAILGLLIGIYRNKRFHGRLIATYLIVEAIARFGIEFVRGDEERRFVFGGLLSTSQFLGLLLLVGGATAYALLARRHKNSGEPDWKPARS